MEETAKDRMLRLALDAFETVSETHCTPSLQGMNGRRFDTIFRLSLMEVLDMSPHKRQKIVESYCDDAQPVVLGCLEFLRALGEELLAGMIDMHQLHMELTQ